MEHGSVRELTDELISLSAAECSNDCFGFLNDAVFSRQLASAEENAFVRLIARARLIQSDNPIYEPVYRYLMHLYLLNGSRLHALARFDRLRTALLDSRSVGKKSPVSQRE